MLLDTSFYDNPQNETVYRESTHSEPEEYKTLCVCTLH